MKSVTILMYCKVDKTSLHSVDIKELAYHSIDARKWVGTEGAGYPFPLWPPWGP